MVWIPVWVKKAQMPGLVHTDIIQVLYFFLSKGARRSGFISFSVLCYRVTKSFNTHFKNSY